MANCTIELSKADMKLLLRYVYYGQWLLTATKTDPDEKYEAFYQRILSLMKNNNIEPRIEYEHGSYGVSGELDDEYHKAIDDYNEDTFWEELLERLAQRDLSLKYTKKEIEDMGYPELSEKLDAEMEKYIDEIDRHGIGNIGIVK